MSVKYRIKKWRANDSEEYSETAIVSNHQVADEYAILDKL